MYTVTASLCFQAESVEDAISKAHLVADKVEKDFSDVEFILDDNYAKEEDD